MLKDTFTIDGRPIGGDASPYVIAEAGSNFNQSKDIARRLIDAAKAAGADAVKFQLFRADVLYPNGGEIYDIFKSVQLDSDWLPDLKAHAAGQGLHFSASAFDRESIKALAALGVPFLKVGSSETTNLDLVARMAAIGKPLFLSTGMCGLGEIADAVEVCLGLGLADVSLMQCQSVYPLEIADANLAAMDTLRASFGGPVGFSDHSLGIVAPIAATARGAHSIEKHFTLDRSMKGPDHFYALEPGELKTMIDGIRAAHQAIGDGVKRILKPERDHGRRNGLWFAAAASKGDVVTAALLEVKRPAVGVKAKHQTAVLGARLARNVAAGDPLTWGDLSFS